jgi:hypothetical protein
MPSRGHIQQPERQFGQAIGPAKALVEKAATAVSYRKGKRRK